MRLGERRFAFPETSIGIYPGLGGTQRLARVVGKELAKFLVMTGRTLDAQNAYQLGLAGYFTSTEEVDGFIRPFRDNSA